MASYATITLYNDGSGNYSAFVIDAPAVRPSGGTRLTQASYTQNATQTENPVPITGATNATPIVITAVAHGYTAGDTVYVAGVGGNTAANGMFIVGTVPTADTFQLQDSVGNAAYTSGGTVRRIAKAKNFWDALENAVTAYQNYRSANG